MYFDDHVFDQLIEPLIGHCNAKYGSKHLYNYMVYQILN